MIDKQASPGWLTLLSLNIVICFLRFVRIKLLTIIEATCIGAYNTIDNGFCFVIPDAILWKSGKQKDEENHKYNNSIDRLEEFIT